MVCAIVECVFFVQIVVHVVLGTSPSDVVVALNAHLGTRNAFARELDKITKFV